MGRCPNCLFASILTESLRGGTPNSISFAMTALSHRPIPCRPTPSHPTPHLPITHSVTPPNFASPHIAARPHHVFVISTPATPAARIHSNPPFLDCLHHGAVDAQLVMISNDGTYCPTSSLPATCPPPPLSLSLYLTSPSLAFHHLHSLFR